MIICCSLVIVRRRKRYQHNICGKNMYFMNFGITIITTSTALLRLSKIGIKKKRIFIYFLPSYISMISFIGIDKGTRAE